MCAHMCMYVWYICIAFNSPHSSIKTAHNSCFRCKEAVSAKLLA